MKNIKTPFLASAVAACLLTLTPNAFSIVVPSGVISTNITNPTNAIWDLTELTELKHESFDLDTLEVAYDLDFVQSGAGKISGSGSNVVSLTVDGVAQPDFPASYTVKGAITSAKGVGHISVSDSVTGTAFIEGANRKATVSEKLNVVIDPVARQIVSGTFSRKASATGLGSLTDSGNMNPEALPDELGDGSWTLSLNLQPDSKNKYSGTNNTATVTLNSGMVYHFTVLGSYVSTTQQSKLVLKGVNEAKGSSLKVTMLADQVTGVLGKVSGQAISVK